MKNKEIIVERIQSFLYSFYAKDIKDARKNEIYHALCHALMEDIGKKWVESKKIPSDKNVYILSFEYLPGKFLENNVRKLNIEDDVKSVLDYLGYTYEEILAYESEPSLGNGEIGIGSSYILNELTKRKIQAVGYSLRYEGGNMKQIIKNGMQVEASNAWLAHGNNWEHRKGFFEEFEIRGKNLVAQAYDIPVISYCGDYVNTLRLFSSRPISKIDFQDFSKGDLIEAYDDYIRDSSITQFLYLDNSSYEGKLLRLKQEYFYARACIHDIFRRYNKYNNDIEKIKDKIKIVVSDIHPALALVEFVKVLHDDYDFSYEKSIAYAREVFEHLVFLITEDSFESYELAMVEKISSDFLSSVLDIDKLLRKEDPDHYIIEGSEISLNRINKNLSNNFLVSSSSMYDYFINHTDYRMKNINIGIDRGLYTSRNKNLKSFLSDFGIKDYSVESIKKIEDFYNDKNFLEGLDKVKLKNKKEFLSKYRPNDSRINPYSIFNVQLANFHEANRQLLNAMSIAHMYYTLKENSGLLVSPTTFIFSGKANEGYYIAKETIKFILALEKMINKDRLIREKIKIVFVEDLNVTKAMEIYPASDIYSDLTLPIFDNNGFEVLSASMNFSNILASRGGISQNKKEKDHSFYLISRKIEDFLKDREDYKVGDYYYGNENIRSTIDKLINEPYDNLSYDFKTIYDYLINSNDSYHIFKDMEELCERRMEISKAYQNKDLWVQNEIDNILWANGFSLDKNIRMLLE